MLTTLFGLIAFGTVCLMPVGEMQDPFVIPELEDPIVFAASETAEQTMIMEEPVELTEDYENESSETGIAGTDTQDKTEEEQESTEQEAENDSALPDSSKTEMEGSKPEEPSAETSEVEPTKPTAEADNPTPIDDTEQEPKEPAHVHTWEDVTEVIHHEAEYENIPIYEEQQVLDAEAWDEEIPTGEFIYSCLVCTFETVDFDELSDHCMTEDHNYCSRQLTRTIHHDAVYHTEKVKVGEEKVLVKDAWDEVIVVGKKCSVCGATAE